MNVSIDVIKYVILSFVDLQGLYRLSNTSWDLREFIYEHLRNLQYIYYDVPISVSNFSQEFLSVIAGKQILEHNVTNIPVCYRTYINDVNINETNVYFSYNTNKILRINIRFITRIVQLPNRLIILQTNGFHEEKQTILKIVDDNLLAYNYCIPLSDTSRILRKIRQLKFIFNGYSKMIYDFLFKRTTSVGINICLDYISHDGYIVEYYINQWTKMVYNFNYEDGMFIVNVLDLVENITYTLRIRISENYELFVRYNGETVRFYLVTMKRIFLKKLNIFVDNVVIESLRSCVYNGLMF